MDYEITTNHITSKRYVYIGLTEWQEMIKKDIRDCILNEFVHNNIRDNEGNILFRASDYLTNTIQPLRKKYTREEEASEMDKFLGINKKVIFDSENYEKEKEQIVNDLVLTIFSKICESNLGPNKKVTSTKRITASGGSLTVNITKEVEQLDLLRGDLIEITLKRIC